MNEALTLFDYTFVNNNANKTLFLLHGTGGNKNDFLFLNDLLDKKYNLVGLQGNVSENGMPRFFKRLSFGVFDQENIKEESAKLAKFITEWKAQHNLQEDHSIFALGYSNGANMLLATLFYYPDLLLNFVLLRAMLPFTPKKLMLTPQHILFISNGLYDQMITKKQQVALLSILEDSKAEIIKKDYASGHELSEIEFNDICTFLQA